MHPNPKFRKISEQIALQTAKAGLEVVKDV